MVNRQTLVYFLVVVVVILEKCPCDVGRRKGQSNLLKEETERMRMRMREKEDGEEGDRQVKSRRPLFPR